MKNFTKLLGIIALAAVIVFAMTGCPPEDKYTVNATNGSVTLINIPSKFNGKYAVAVAANPNLIGASGISDNGTMTFGTIADGSVTLKVWAPEPESFNAYAGNDSNVQLIVMVLSAPTANFEDALQSIAVGYDILTVSFTNGVATNVDASSVDDMPQ